MTKITTDELYTYLQSAIADLTRNFDRLNAINERIDLIVNAIRRLEKDNESTHEAIEKQLSDFKLKEKFSELENKIKSITDFMNSRITLEMRTNSDQLKNFEKEIVDLKKKIESLENEISQLKQRNTKVENELTEHGNIIRAGFYEIHSKVEDVELNILKNQKIIEKNILDEKKEGKNV